MSKIIEFEGHFTEIWAKQNKVYFQNVSNNSIVGCGNGGGDGGVGLCGVDASGGGDGGVVVMVVVVK